MLLINLKVELKLKMTKYCVLASNCILSADANSNKISFSIKDRELHVPVVTLSPKYSQKLSKIVSKRFERSVYWNECKKKKQCE